MHRIQDMLTRDRVINLSGTSKDGALIELCALTSKLPQVSDPDKFLSAIQTRETIMSTGIGMGIAIPHAKTQTVTDFIMAVGRSEAGIDFHSLDGYPVHLVILIGASHTQGDEFLKVLSMIGSFFNSDIHRKRFLAAETPDDIYRMFQHLDEHINE